MAAVDEDTELRDLVAQTLESNGVLGKIKAQLRASVFLALEEVDPQKQKVPFVNPDLRKYISTPNGSLAFSLILDFLEHFKLEFTNAVFVPECSMSDKREATPDLRHKLNLPVITSPDAPTPVLGDVVSRLQGGSSGSSSSSPAEDLTADQLEKARERFSYYDQNKDGVIDKEELRCLFIDTFPAFNRNMLDRYVNDEFRAADRDFSSNYMSLTVVEKGIDFSEFVGMYRRLFLQCRSVVSHDVKDIVESKKSLLRPKSDINHKSLFEEIVDNNEPQTDNKIEVMTPDDIMDDPFFDDLLPAATKNLASRLTSDVRSTSSDHSQHTLTDMRSTHSDHRSEGKSIDRKNSEIEYVPTEEYEDDFSSMHSLSLKSSARSLKSSHNIGEGVAEEIEEFIDEDISIEGDDLLKSHSSIGFDEITTDQTVSQHDNGFDYSEDLV